MTLADLLNQIVECQQGFLLDADVAELATLDRLRQVLIRCGNCRFTAAAQDVAHIIGMIEETGKDYVRDASLPANDDAHRGVRRAHTFEGSYQPKPPQRPPQPMLGPFPAHCGCGGCEQGTPSDADPGL